MSDTDSLIRTSDPGHERAAPPLTEQAQVTAANPILVAVDLTEESRAALLWACTYAQKTAAPVMALHVLHDPAGAPGAYSRNAPDPLTPMRDTAEQMLDAFMTEQQANHPVLTALAEAQRRVIEGLPAGRIVDEAVRLKAALIVVGSRGQTGLPKLVNGSVAHKVIELSPIPVTVVKAPR